MIIYDFDVFDTALGPDEVDAVFVIDTDGMRAFAVALKRFQPIAGRDPQVVEPLGDVELLEFAEGNLLEVSWRVRPRFARVDLLGGFAAEQENHLLHSYAAHY